MPSEKCYRCRKFVSSKDGVKCNTCCLLQHKSCASLPAKVTVSPTWRCLECRNIGLKPKIHLVSDEAQQIESPEFSGESSEMNSFSKKEKAKKTDVSNSDILEEIKLMRLDFVYLRNEISEMKMEVESCLKRLDNLEVRIDVLEKSTTIQKDVPHDINMVISQLRSDLNDRDQELLANDIEIRNIPEEKGENPTQLIVSIAAKIGVKLENRDIVNVERVGGRLLQSAGEAELRPRVLVARLARRDLRDEMMRNARTRRTTDVGLVGKPCHFYVNERLTRTNRQLFRQARNAGRHNGWQYIWTSRGRVFARRKSGEPVVKIRVESDIVEKIGPLTDNV